MPVRMRDNCMLSVQSNAGGGGMKRRGAGGSLLDVQALAGHSSLNTTQRYIEVNLDAKRRVVEVV